MNTTPDLHTPTPDFRERLELEIVRAARRESALTSARRSWLRPRLQTAALLIVTLAVGAVVGAAPAQIQDARQRDALLAAAQSQQLVVQLRLQLAAENLRVMESRRHLDLVTGAEVHVAEAAFRKAEHEVARLNLNMAEIRITSSAPNDAISAPLVGGRDFVKERLMLDATVAQYPIPVAENALTIARHRRELGVASHIAVAEAEAELERARAELQLVAEKIALRERFLTQGTAPAEAERLYRVMELRKQLVAARAAVGSAEMRFELVKLQEARGVVGREAVLRGELEVLERQSVVEFLVAQLKILDPGG
jgi:hypothetical protein